MWLRLCTHYIDDLLPHEPLELCSHWGCGQVFHSLYKLALYCCHMTCVCRVLQQLRALVAMNENLKKQEQQFKAHCKVGQAVVLFKRVYYELNNHCFPTSQDEKARLEEAIARLSSGFDAEGGEEDERMVAIKQHLQADREKLTKIRALLVRQKLSISVY